MSTQPTTRLVYVDALRGLAILLMVVDHAFDWWLRAEFHSTAWGRVTEFLGTLAAPLFLFLMGISLALSAQRRWEQGMRASRLAASLVRRGAFLIAQGYAVTWIAFYNGRNLAEIGAVDVLHCLGLSLLVLVPLVLVRAAPITLLAAGATGILGLWAGDWHLPPWAAAWINGMGGVSYFPVLPFVVYALVGLGVGQLLARTSDQPRGTRRLMLALVLVGAGLIALVPLVPPDLGVRFPRPVFLLFSLSILLWVTGAAYALARWPAVLRPLARTGQAAMMIYVVHHLVGFRLFYHLGWVSGHSWQGQYGVFSPGTACFLLGILLAMLYGSAKLWLAWRPRIGSAALVRRFVPVAAAFW